MNRQTSLLAATAATLLALLALPAHSLKIVSGSTTDENGNLVDRNVAIDEGGRCDIVENGTLVGGGLYGGDPSLCMDWARWPFAPPG